MAFKLFSVSVRYKVICWNEMHFCDLDDFFFFSQLLTIDTFLDEWTSRQMLRGGGVELRQGRVCEVQVVKAP